MSMQTINSFRDEYYFLSNMYPVKVQYNGQQYNSSEAAFQAAKCADPVEAIQFLTLEAHKAKRAGRKVKLRPDWENVKVEIMEEILRNKFSNPEMRNLLINTYPVKLIEGNTWHDTFWGVDTNTGNGQNNLGKLLMKIREEMLPKIVVLGGSFNPPTKAHSALLKDAVAAVDAEFGIFVPSSDKYVSRKMDKARRNREPSQVFSEDARLKMLESICKMNHAFKVDTCEYGDDGRGHTYDTLSKLQQKYPNHKLLFLIGADKLSILPKWHNHDAFFKNFGFLVTVRNGIDAQSIIKNHPVLSQYQHIFHFMPELEDYADISSTAVRKALINNKESAKSMLDNGAWEIVSKK